MVDRRRRARPAAGLEGLGWGITAVVIVLACAAIHFTLWFGHRVIDGTGERVPANPVDMFDQLASGQLSWPPSAVPIATGVVGFLAVVSAVVLWQINRYRKRTASRRASRRMGQRSDLAGYTGKQAIAKAARLGVSDPKRYPGVLIGETIEGRDKVYASWEDMILYIAGPRRGKTTSHTVPMILDAPGPAVATSNKRDLVDATRKPRAERGRVWIFDPQQIVQEPPRWWWDPLSYVTDEVHAAQLADHFASGSRRPDARSDAFFDPAGKDLLAGLLLAAACNRDPITQVWRWLTAPQDSKPVEILESAGYELTADQVGATISAPEKQRGGIYGTAMQMAAALTSRQVAEWTTPQGTDDPRPQFDPQQFLTSTDTLYALSREGRGTAGPLVTALTVAVIDAAERHAARQRGGRLATPMQVTLDEAANVVKWSELPDMYSHLGSRGIVISTVLQTWKQGVGVWGAEGMDKLWGASNVRVYGGGEGDERFLDKVSQLIGDYDRFTGSVSTGGKDRQVTRQISRERIMDVADLGALPRGEAVVFASGVPPTLVHQLPWMQSRHADAVRASKDEFEPKGEPQAVSA